jgi:hypothetical protein
MRTTYANRCWPPWRRTSSNGGQTVGSNRFAGGCFALLGIVTP